MRLPRVRITVRLMMGVVAVVAIALGAVQLKLRRDGFLKRVAAHKMSETIHRSSARMFREFAEFDENHSARLFEQDQKFKALKLPRRLETPASKNLDRIFEEEWITILENSRRQAVIDRARAERFDRTATYHAEMKRKYRRAAARPWWLVPEDPPPPDPIDQARYWTQKGDHKKASERFQEALREEPDPNTLNEYAWLLATCPDPKLRDGPRAVELATQACEQSAWKDGAMIDTLAAAFAESGDFKNAVGSQQRAIKTLNPADPTLQGFRDRLDLYQSGRAYRESQATIP